MNFYPRYPAHYLAKTLHLSMEQDGAYTRLLDWCYSNERAIPNGQRYAIARATKASEKRCVDEVLSEFFTQEQNGWTNGRALDELEIAAPKIEAARLNGRKGGRPRKDKPTGFAENNPVGLQDETHKEPSAKAPQSPRDKDQEIPPTAGALAPDPIFGVGLDFLTRKSVPEKAARSFLGLLRKEIHDDLTVAALLTEAERQDISDPVSWLMKAAKSRKANSNATPTHRESVAERISRINAEAEGHETRGALDHAA